MMVEVKGLAKRFGAITAVRDVSFSVGQGEVLGFLGPNGAGKSTTMRMITGFLTPDAGRVLLDGEDIALHPVAARARIGYLPEGAPLYGEMTARGFLRFVAGLRGYRGAELASRVGEVSEKIALHGVLDRPIETLSKGYKRRVGLAQAILHDPDILVLDEPTDGLDPNQKHEVRNLIRGMARDKVTILSTHILEEVDAVCTRAIVIADGRVVADGTPDELAARSPLHNSIRIGIRGAGLAECRAALSALAGVKAIEPVSEGPELCELRVLPEAGRSLVSEVGNAIRERGWDVAELHVERGELDAVFRMITQGEERPAASA
jgi:ABC-2 type transport system ATP-binding protein